MQPSFKAFADELQKHALSLGTMQNYLGARAAQGVGGAAALGHSLAGTAASTTREAVQGMSGLQRHRLGAVMEGGQAHRAMQALPGKVGLGQTAAATRDRVGQAIKQEAQQGGSRTGGVPLSKAYEGYMTNSRRSYNTDHVSQVMGLSKDQQWTPKGGPTKLMGGGLNTRATTPSATTGITPVVPSGEPTAITRPAPATPAAGPTVPPPGRLRRAPAVQAVVQ